MVENIDVNKNTWVIDASFTIPAIYNEKESGKVKKFLSNFYNSQKLLAPSLWSYEIGNFLRYKTLNTKDLSEAMILLGYISIRFFPNPPLSEVHLIVSLAQKHELSFYDASYLHLAINQKSGLATFDNKLQEAARKENILLLTDIWI